ncbi:hypothetical protein GGP64_002522 [Salinibacter ruber]|nr:hypothetical protein [Salinibacter ruber]
MMSRSWSRWAAACAFAAGLVVLYFTAWRPARALYMQHVTHPLLTSIETERGTTFRYEFEQGALRIGLRSSQYQSGSNPTDYHAPAGRDFLIAAFLPILLFPFRPYWLYLWGFNLAVGALFLALVALGVAWVDWAFLLQGFLEKYVVQALNLGAPLLAWAYERDILSPASTGESSP